MSQRGEICNDDTVRCKRVLKIPKGRQINLQEQQKFLRWYVRFTNWLIVLVPSLDGFSCYQKSKHKLSLPLETSEQKLICLFYTFGGQNYWLLD